MAIKSITNNAMTSQEISLSTQKQGHFENGSNSVVGVESSATVVLQKASNEENANSDGQQQMDAEANAQRLKSAVNQANNTMKRTRTGCEFTYHEKTNRVSIKVYDKDTNEVLREIPPEESLEMLEKIWEIAGLLVDERR